MQNQTSLALGQHSDSSDILPEITEDNRVSARALHGALRNSGRFDDWVRYRCSEYGFTEGVDYVAITEKIPGNLGGRPQTDYLLSLDMAKELAMVERNEAGRRVRRYFIEVEKRARAVYAAHSAAAPALPGEALAKIQQINSGLIAVAGEHAGRIAALEATARPGPDWQSVGSWLEARGIGMSLGRVAWSAKRCLEESARRSMPAGTIRRRGGSGVSRTFAPEVLDHILPTLIMRWEARDTREAYRG